MLMASLRCYSSIIWRHLERESKQGDLVAKRERRMDSETRLLLRKSWRRSKRASSSERVLRLFLVVFACFLGRRTSVEAFVTPISGATASHVCRGRLIVLQNGCCGSHNNSNHRVSNKLKNLFSKTRGRIRRPLRLFPNQTTSRTHRASLRQRILRALVPLVLAFLLCCMQQQPVLAAAESFFGSDTALEASTVSGRALLQSKSVAVLGELQSKSMAVVGGSFPRVGRTLQTLWATIMSRKRRILCGLLSLFLGKSLLNLYRVKQRQKEDATSEWGRYAQYPAARSRAIASLLFLKLAPLFALMALVSRKGSPRRDRLQRRAGDIFADNLIRASPLYIKIGQILSCRDNVLPVQWKDAMERLQDQVPSQSGEKAQRLAYLAWPGGESSFHRTFEDMNWTPLAAASLGQVHAAKLRDTGAPVALKLQRPFLRKIYDEDFRLLTRIASIVDQYFGSTAGSVGGVQQSWTEIFQDAEEILYREIDYRAEAENAMRFCRDFGLSLGGKPAKETAAKSRDGEPLPSAAPWLRTPYVYDNLSNEQVLVMENVPSIKITASAKLDAANVTMEDREYLADCLGRSYLRQFCCNKFFSTDPHAGNLGVELLDMSSSIPEERVRLVYYDFGQAAELQPNQAEGILEIIEAIVDMDVDRSVSSFQKMGVLKEGADLSVVRAKVANNYRTGKVKANRKKLRKRGYKFRNVTSAASSASSATNSTESSGGGDAAVMKYFTLPAEYAFVGRALSQMNGVGKSLDPEFDFVSAAAPWIYEIKGAGLYIKEEALKWITSFPDRVADFFCPRGDDGAIVPPQERILTAVRTAAGVLLAFLISASKLITRDREPKTPIWENSTTPIWDNSTTPIWDDERAALVL